MDKEYKLTTLKFRENILRVYKVAEKIKYKNNSFCLN